MHNKISNIDLNPRKNTINRHYYEVERLLNLVFRGYMTRSEAKAEFRKYLKEVYGR